MFQQSLHLIRPRLGSLEQPLKDTSSNINLNHIRTHKGSKVMEMLIHISKVKQGLICHKLKQVTNNITTVTGNTASWFFSTEELLVLIDTVRPRSLTVINDSEWFCFWMMRLSFVNRLRSQTIRISRQPESFSIYTSGSQTLGHREHHQRKPPFCKISSPKVPNA